MASSRLRDNAWLYSGLRIYLEVIVTVQQSRLGIVSGTVQGRYSPDIAEKCNALAPFVSAVCDLFQHPKDGMADFVLDWVITYGHDRCMQQIEFFWSQIAVQILKDLGLPSTFSFDRWPFDHIRLRHHVNWISELAFHRNRAERHSRQRMLRALTNAPYSKPIGWEQKDPAADGTNPDPNALHKPLPPPPGFSKKTCEETTITKKLSNTHKAPMTQEEFEAFINPLRNAPQNNCEYSDFAKKTAQMIFRQNSFGPQSSKYSEEYTPKPKATSTEYKPDLYEDMAKKMLEMKNLVPPDTDDSRVLGPPRAFDEAYPADWWNDLAKHLPQGRLEKSTPTTTTQKWKEQPAPKPMEKAMPSPMPAPISKPKRQKRFPPIKNKGRGTKTDVLQFFDIEEPRIQCFTHKNKAEHFAKERTEN